MKTDHILFFFLDQHIAKNSIFSKLNMLFRFKPEMGFESRILVCESWMLSCYPAILLTSNTSIIRNEA